MKILHVLDHSLPYFSGYSFRSDYLLRAQQQMGLQPIVLTSPKHETFSATLEHKDDIPYYRTPWPAISASPQMRAVPMVRQMASIAALTKEIVRLATELQVNLIHAHSPSLNGLAAVRAAGQLQLPWIYELRYYEEDAAVDRGKTRYNSLRYRLAQRLEMEALTQATRIVTISHALRDDLVLRGISPNKIAEVPNGVDTNYFQPREPDAELLASLALTGHTVIGFLGSFYYYEGLTHLLEAMLQLLARRRDLKLLLVGAGEAEPVLRERIPAELQAHFVFTGNVPHEDVRRYYSVMDVLVYPRVRSRLTELTTPLKPLEAMAMGKAVVGSNVGGIRELFAEGEVGELVRAEDPDALAASLETLADSASLRDEAGKRARAFVIAQRSWDAIVTRYLPIYEAALAG